MFDARALIGFGQDDFADELFDGPALGGEASGEAVEEFGMGGR